jgi:hypothetical protein
MPGTDIAETLAVVLGELPDLPHLPELPARGPGSDLVGRGAGFLTALPVDLQPSGWRLVDRPGHDAQRIRDFLERDLDALTEAADGYTGLFKLQACGPWTLASTLELHYGNKVLADHGAVRDLSESLADGLRMHVADVRRRVPGARLIVQIDEPGLPGVLAGQVRTASGFGTLRRPSENTVRATLATVMTAITSADAVPIVHCCAPDVPWELLREAGAVAISADLTLLGTAAKDIDILGEQLDTGMGLLAGVVPAVDSGDAPERPADRSGSGRAIRHDGSRAAAPGGSEIDPDTGELSDPTTSVGPVQTLWRTLGLEPERMATQVAVSPTCGLAGASPVRARAVLRTCREAARRLPHSTGARG